MFCWLTAGGTTGISNRNTTNSYSAGTISGTNAGGIVGNMSDVAFTILNRIIATDIELASTVIEIGPPHLIRADQMGPWSKIHSVNAQ